MTQEEKKRMLDSFRKPVKEPEDPWTEERLLEAAKRIIERLGLNEELQ